MNNLTFYKTQQITDFRHRPLVYVTLWRWRLKANNGRIIGASTQGYRRKIDCVKNATQVGLYIYAISMQRKLNEK